jgi:hypothetical protein
MILAAILGVLIFGPASPALASTRVPAFLVPSQDVANPPTGSQTGSQTQPPSAPGSASPSPSKSPPSKSSPKPSASSAHPVKRKPRRKVPDCAGGPGTPKPAPGSAAAKTSPSSAGSAKGASAPLKPCPPPKVVIRNGGSPEPTVELKGDTTAEHASDNRFTTDQLEATTEENLKKATTRQLDASQQEMVAQIKEFADQSKKAAEAGDLELAHNLAMKAQLLSEELVKP